MTITPGQAAEKAVQSLTEQVLDAGQINGLHRLLWRVLDADDGQLAKHDNGEPINNFKHGLAQTIRDYIDAGDLSRQRAIEIITQTYQAPRPGDLYIIAADAGRFDLYRYGGDAWVKQGMITAGEAQEIATTWRYIKSDGQREYYRPASAEPRQAIT